MKKKLTFLHYLFTVNKQIVFIRFVFTPFERHGKKINELKIHLLDLQKTFIVIKEKLFEYFTKTYGFLP